ncbi:MAG: nucleotidyltransferase family protein [Pseudomonadota bacterium]
MSRIPQTAMVLAAGKGTRMRPLTDVTPKPLIRVAGKALIDFALDRFASAGVERAVVNVHHFADQLEAHLQGRSHPDVLISDERDALLETGGGLMKARPLFGDDAIYCTNTDAILIDGDGPEPCARLADAWRPDAMDALLLLAPIARASGYDGRGDFDRTDDGRIALRAGDRAEFVFTGLQILSPALIDEGPGGAFSTRLLWDAASARGRLYGAVHSGDWLHVGDPAGLAAAEAVLADRAT